MYFANHRGSCIYLAYSNALSGPWRVHETGTLKLEGASSFRDHIASPDIHIDEGRQRVHMYFHGPRKDAKGQWTSLATSTDGLHFETSNEILGRYYFRVWSWEGAWYALAKQGNKGWGELYRSEDGLTGFKPRGRFLRRARHTAVTIRGHHLLIFYSRTGDAPERILVSTVDLRPDWQEWEPSAPIEVLRPSAPYEGIRHPIKHSRHGAVIKANQLRDPCVYEEDNRTYLFYTIAGEMGIAMAELQLEMITSA